MSTHLSADLYGICTVRPSVCSVFLPRGVNTAIQTHKDTPTCPGSPSFVETYAHVLRGMCLGEWKQTFLCIQVHMCQKNTSAMPLPYTHPGTRPSSRGVCRPHPTGAQKHMFGFLGASRVALVAI